MVLSFIGAAISGLLCIIASRAVHTITLLYFVYGTNCIKIYREQEKITPEDIELLEESVTLGQRVFAIAVDISVFLFLFKVCEILLGFGDNLRGL